MPVYKRGENQTKVVVIAVVPLVVEVAEAHLVEVGSSKINNNSHRSRHSSRRCVSRGIICVRGRNKSEFVVVIVDLTLQMHSRTLSMKTIGEHICKQAEQNREGRREFD